MFRLDKIEVGYDSETKTWVVSDPETLEYGSDTTLAGAFERYIKGLQKLECMCTQEEKYLGSFMKKRCEAVTDRKVIL